MRKKGLWQENQNEIGTITYVNGVGFLHADRRRFCMLAVRRFSTIICLFLLLYPILQKLYLLPATRLGYLLGMNIQINFYTGLVITDEVTRNLLVIWSNILSLLSVLLFCFATFHRSVRSMHILKRPHSGITTLSIPIVLVCGLVGIGLSLLLNGGLDLFGFVFPLNMEKITSFSMGEISIFIASLFFALLQEVLFRGVLLAPLRRFGDSFALVATALLFSLWAGDLFTGIIWFFLSLPLGYFVMRSGSIFTAIIARFSFELLLFAVRACAGMVEQSLAIVIILLALILIIFFSGVAFIGFAKADRAAFQLYNIRDGLTVSAKLGYFLTSFGFLVMIVFWGSRIVSSVQIIG